MGMSADEARRVVLYATKHPANLARLTKIPGERGPIQFSLWDSQAHALELALGYRMLLVLKARQLGMTWVLGALLGLWDCLRPVDGETLILSRTDDDAKAVIGRANYLYQNLPAEVRALLPLEIDTSSRIAIRHGNGCLSGLLSLSSSSRAGAGRTFRRLIGDEGAHWEHPEQRMAAIIPTVADIGSLVFLSTAAGPNFFEALYRGARDAPAGRVLTQEEIDLGNGFVRAFYGALDRPDRTYADIMRRREVLGFAGPQEYPLSSSEAFIASGHCVFDADALATYSSEVVCPPVRTASFHDGRLVEGTKWQIWTEPQPGRAYLITADPCGSGGGRDYAYAAIWDTRSWDQVAAFHGKPEPMLLGIELMEAGRAYNDALLAPEANSHGAGVVSIIVERGYLNVYHRERTNTYVPGMTNTVGWETTPKTRFDMLAALKDVIRYRDLGIMDPEVITECEHFVESRSQDGRSTFERAEVGYHDDRVMTCAIAAHVLQFSDQIRVKPARPPQRPVRYRVSSLTGYFRPPTPSVFELASARFSRRGPVRYAGANISRES